MKKLLMLMPVLFAAMSFTVFAQAAATITAQPAATTIVFAGFIEGSLNVGASAAGGQALSFQWFRNTANNNAGGTAVAGATSANFIIPTNLPPGEHFFFIEVRAGGGTPTRSNVATVRVFDFEECDLC